MACSPVSARTEITLHLAPSAALDPRRISVLRAVDKHGSITRGAHALEMSYRHAWLILDELNRMFRQPLVKAWVGHRGGARLTPAGQQILALYDNLCRKASETALPEASALAAMLNDKANDQTVEGTAEPETPRLRKAG